MSKLLSLIDRVRLWHLRRKLREGVVVSNFIAKDVRRDILIVSVAKLGDGLILARVRTTNVLYASMNLAAVPDFGQPEELQVRSMWNWSGATWGGLPNGRTIAETSSGVDRKSDG